MEYIAGHTNFKYNNSAVTLGKFDGLHLGHKQLIDLVVSYKKQGMTTVMFSFLMHPSNILAEKEFETIYTEEEKWAKMKKSGIDVLISYPFTEETRKMEPLEFIQKVLIERLDAKVIIVGNDFKFGADRKGNVEFLKSYEESFGYKVIACEKVTYKNEIISSSVIRNAIKEGNINLANAMLGHAYSIRGKVVHGRRLGRTIGMPTTNLIPGEDKLLPPCGVYASKTVINGIRYSGVTNIGYKPTVGADDTIGVETFIFDYDNDLYGEIIEVELYHYLRPEKKFGSLEELILRMKVDIKNAREYF